MNVLQELMSRYPMLANCNKSICRAYDVLVRCYKSGGKILACGNGGSAADADHIVGELLNKFKRKRPLDPIVAGQLPCEIANKLVGALPAISLVAMSAVLSSIANDADWDMAFAQQVCGLGKRGDVLLAISTSGNSANCVNAAHVARAMEMQVVALTGRTGGRLAQLADVAICVPEDETFKIQELHLPIYHALCAALEIAIFTK